MEYTEEQRKTATKHRPEANEGELVKPVHDNLEEDQTPCEKKPLGRSGKKEGADRGRPKKPVNQYDLEGHYIQTFEGLKEAKHATGAPSIPQVLTDEASRRSSGGFQWRYDTGNHEDIPPCRLHARCKAVYQIDPRTGELISTYPSIMEASEATGTRESSIIDSCKKVQSTVNGYIWRYADDPETFTPMEITDSRRHYNFPVNQYDLQGHYIRTFKSISEAKKTVGATAIACVLCKTSGHMSSGGYLWRYDTGNHEDIPPIRPNANCKAVCQIEPGTGKLISTYPSIKEAAKAIGVRPGSITDSCRRLRSTAKGYIWRYADDPEAAEPEK